MKELLAPAVFLALFFGIVGTALYLTPKLAAWVERKRGEGFADSTPSDSENTTAQDGTKL